MLSPHPGTILPPSSLFISLLQVVSLLLLLLLNPEVKLRLGEVLCSCYTAQFFCMDRPLLAAFERLDVQLLNNPPLIARMDAQV